MSPLKRPRKRQRAQSAPHPSPHPVQLSPATNSNVPDAGNAKPNRSSSSNLCLNPVQPPLLPANDDDVVNRAARALLARIEAIRSDFLSLRDHHLRAAANIEQKLSTKAIAASAASRVKPVRPSDPSLDFAAAKNATILPSFDPHVAPPSAPDPPTLPTLALITEPPPSEKLIREQSIIIRAQAITRKNAELARERLPKQPEAQRNKTWRDYFLDEVIWMATDFREERKWKIQIARKTVKLAAQRHQQKANRLARAQLDQHHRTVRLANTVARDVRKFWSQIREIADFRLSRVERVRRLHQSRNDLNKFLERTQRISKELAMGLQQPILNATDLHQSHSKEQTSVQSRSLSPTRNATTNGDAQVKQVRFADPPFSNPSLSEPCSSRKHASEPVKPPCSQRESDSSSLNPVSGNGSHLSAPARDTSSFASGPSETLHHTPHAARTDSLNTNGISSKKVNSSSVLKPNGVDGKDDSLVHLDCTSTFNEHNVSMSRPGGSDRGESSLSRPFVGKDLGTSQISTDKSSMFHSLDSDSRERDRPVENGLVEPSATSDVARLIRTPAELLRGTLRDYQFSGMQWLVNLYRNNSNGILADEMGLGKTIQTISLLAWLAIEQKQWGPHLVIVPTSVMLNWEVEFKRWLPGFKILTYFGSIKERRMKRKGWTDPELFHVCITSYTLAVQDVHILRRRKWFYVILDEAHNIKNFRSQRWQTLLTLSSQRRLLLTGTPLQNSVMELWSLMHFLMPNLFESQSEFKDWFSNPLQGSSGVVGDQSRVVSQLHTVLRPFVLRRLKVDVEKGLPPKHEHVLKCRLSKRQRELYEDFLSRSDVKENLNSGDMFKIMNVLMQLRKVCNHPDLFEGRPILSPFAMNSIFYAVPSRILGLCRTSTQKSVNLALLNVDICTRELTWPGLWHSSEEEFMSIEHVVQSVMQARLHADDEILRVEKARVGEAGLRRKERALAFRRSTLLHMAVVSAHRVRERGLLGEDLRSACTMTPSSLMESIRLNSSSRSQFIPNVTSNVVSSLEHLSTRSAPLMERFVCCITKASAPSVEIRYQGDDSDYNHWRDDYLDLNSFTSPYRSLYRSYDVRSQVTIPDKRLIQWDCGKLQLLDGLLRDLKHRGSRVLIFTQMTKMLDVLESFLNLHTFRYLRLDGATKTDDRQKVVHRFNTDMKIFCMILTTRAGGVGLNLIGADSVIFYDTDYNPAVDNQAQDRAHRIGQTKPVHVYRLICEQTVEEGILARARLKQQLETKIISEAGFTTDAIVSRELNSATTHLGIITSSSGDNRSGRGLANNSLTINALKTGTLGDGVDSAQGRFHGFGPLSFDQFAVSYAKGPLHGVDPFLGSDEFQKLSDKVLSEDERERFAMDASAEEQRMLEAEFEDIDESGLTTKIVPKSFESVDAVELDVKNVLSPVQIFALQFLECVENRDAEAVDDGVCSTINTFEENDRGVSQDNAFETSGTGAVHAKGDVQNTYLSSTSVPNDDDTDGNDNIKGNFRASDQNDDAVANDDMFYELDITEDGRVNYLKALTDADVDIKLYLPLRDGGPEELKVSSVVCGTAAAGLECAEDAAFFPHAYNRMSRTQFATRRQKEKSLAIIRKRMAEKEARRYNSDTSLPNGPKANTRDRGVISKSIHDSKLRDSAFTGISTSMRKTECNSVGEVSNETSRGLEDKNGFISGMCSSSNQNAGLVSREDEEVSRKGVSDIAVKSLSAGERSKLQKQKSESSRGNGTVARKKIRNHVDAGAQSGLFKKSSKKLSRKATLMNFKGAATAALSGTSGVSGKNIGWTKEEDEKLISLSTEFGNNMLLVADALASDKKAAVGMRQRRTRAHCTQRLCTLMAKDKASPMASPRAETKDIDVEKKHELGLLGTFPHQLYVYTTGQVPENSSGDVHITQKRVIADAKAKLGNEFSTGGLLIHLNSTLMEAKKGQNNRPGLKSRECTSSALNRRKRPFMQPIKEELSLTKSVFTLNQYGSGMQVNGSGAGVVGVETTEAAASRLSNVGLQRSAPGAVNLASSRVERGPVRTGSTNIGAAGSGHVPSAMSGSGRGRGSSSSGSRNGSAVKLASSKLGAAPISSMNAGGRANVFIPSSKKTPLASGVASTGFQASVAGKNRTAADMTNKGAMSGNFKKEPKKAVNSVKGVAATGVVTTPSIAAGRVSGTSGLTNNAVRPGYVKGSGGRGAPLTKVKATNTTNRIVPGKQKMVMTATPGVRGRGTFVNSGSNTSKTHNGDTMNCAVGPKISSNAVKMANGVNKLSSSNNVVHVARHGASSTSVVPRKTDLPSHVNIPSESGIFQDSKVVAPSNVIGSTPMPTGAEMVVVPARTAKGSGIGGCAALPSSFAGMAVPPVVPPKAGFPPSTTTTAAGAARSVVASGGQVRQAIDGTSQNGETRHIGGVVPKERHRGSSVDGNNGTGAADRASVKPVEEKSTSEARFSGGANGSEGVGQPAREAGIESKKISGKKDGSNEENVEVGNKKDIGQFVRELVEGERITKTKTGDEANVGKTGG